MSELRQDLTNKSWVIMAPERAKRPQTETKAKPADEVPEWDAACPFCPGNEEQTCGETFRLPQTGQSSRWEVRVVPNRFPALMLKGSSERREEDHFFRTMDGYGAHEVIIETPSHNTPPALMAYEHVEKVLTAYLERYTTLKKNRQFRFITIFKNHGWASGTSLVHPHSQLVATPIMATYYHRKYDVAHDYHADMGRCLYCDLIAAEMEKGERIVAETERFIIFHPYASRVPYETWIIPKRHCASFGLVTAGDIPELARVLKDSLLCLYREMDNPAFNYVIDTSTTDVEDDPYYHWHLRIVPRLTTIAGFEIGSGIYISSALPEETAKLMRKCCYSLLQEGKVCLVPAGRPSTLPDIKQP
ncbi:MAG: galactose-1-phosphate uridylyltransferase [Chloroflexota bacterium]